jgi:AbrB family looped-hinge helix DNA binding protein
MSRTPRMSRLRRRPRDAPRLEGGTRRWSTRLSSGGRVVLPAEVRAGLGLADGDAVQVTVEDGKIVLLPLTEVVRRLQAKYRRLISGDRSLADELIADRRAEAKRE